jgi:hypothetical protein
MSEPLSGFEFTVPVWTLVHEASLWDQGLPAAVLHLSEGHTGTTTWPVFTDVGLAKRFADAAPVTAGVVPLPLGGFATVCGLLEDLIAAGFEQVVIDPSYLEGSAPMRLGTKELLGLLRSEDEPG